MATVNIGTYSRLNGVLNQKIQDAMQKTTDTLLEELIQEIDRDIYNGKAKQYEPTGEFRDSYHEWKIEDSGNIIKRVLESDPEYIFAGEQPNGWYAHAATFWSNHPEQRYAMDYILNGHMYTDGSWPTHNSEPYWDRFRANWTEDKIKEEFRKNLGL